MPKRDAVCLTNVFFVLHDKRAWLFITVGFLTDENYCLSHEYNDQFLLTFYDMS